MFARFVLTVLLLCGLVFAELSEKVETDDFEKLAKDLENDSPLEIIDKALEKFGNDITIAFRYQFITLCIVSIHLIADYLID